MKSLIVLLALSTILAANAQEKYVTYYDNGSIKESGFIKGDVLDSVYVSYYENGNKKEEGVYKNCEYKTNAISVYVASCGTGKQEKPYPGKRNGQWKAYHENGQLKSIDEYFCGIRNGSGIKRDSQGKLEANYFYNAGQVIQEQDYYENGNLATFTYYSYEYVYNKKEKSYTTETTEKTFEYYETGELEIISQKTNNGLNDRYVEYWPNGFVKTEAHYIDDDKTGICFEYYPNGNTKTAGRFKDDKPVGKHYFYKETGEQDRIETWKNEKLVKTEPWTAKGPVTIK
jgi:antitoxin component YwqK of YwqJK toxin-antitoxin module